MFGTQFYPTPYKLILDMLDHYKDLTQGSYILEPSAGKGDIADVIKTRTTYGYGNKNPRIHCIELDPNLSGILRDKGFQVLGDDFLSFVPQISYDYIIMNPPFAQGAKHLLHAWDILIEGEICCLLNAETLRNAHTRERTILKGIIEQHGTVEFLQSQFVEAERKTNVEIALVRLSKKSEQFTFNLFGDDEKESHPSLDLSEGTLNSEVAVRNVVGNIVAEYEAVKREYVDCWKHINKIHTRLYRITKSYVESERGGYKDIYGIFLESLSCEVKSGYNMFSEGLNKASWQYIFEKTNAKSLMTAKVKEQYDKVQKQSALIPFTEINIKEFLLNLKGNAGAIADACIEEIFDLFTKYYDENRVYFEGWKTNDCWKVNKKVVLPYVMELDWHNHCTLSHRRTHELADIDRAMCFLSGKEYGSEEVITIEEAIKSRIQEQKDTQYFTQNKCSSTFFDINYYKKGTIHLRFKDKKLLERMNIGVARKRKWLPPAK